MKYGMVVDVTRCNGCYNCFLACRDEYCGNDFLPYSASQPQTGHHWMRVVETERGEYPKIKVAYTAIPCLQCERPLCVEMARHGESGADTGGSEEIPASDGRTRAAIYKRDDGIALIDPEAAGGREDLVDSCPYGVIFWNEEKQLPQKCTFCAHLLDMGWTEPRCVEACPTRALIFGDLDDPGSEVARLVASGKTEVLQPEHGMEDKVTYIGLPKRFVAGAVVFGDTDSCGEGARVTLLDMPVTHTVIADSYGDFEFEGLPADMTLTLRVEATGYESRELVVHTASDVYLREIVLVSKSVAESTADGLGGKTGAPGAPREARGGSEPGGR